MTEDTPPMVAWFDRQIARLEEDIERWKADVDALGVKIDRHIKEGMGHG